MLIFCGLNWFQFDLVIYQKKLKKNREIDEISWNVFFGAWVLKRGQRTLTEGEGSVW
jgi:hypothetical protein